MSRVLQHHDDQPVILTPSARTVPVTIAVLANLLIVSLPLHCWWQTATINSVAFLLASSLLCGFELTSESKTSEVLNDFGRYQKLATAGGILLLLLQWCSLTESRNRGFENTSAAGCGFLITMAGCAIRIAAIGNLRHAFSSKLTNSKLITTGIHSAMRHPSETGLFMACVGLTVVAGSLYSAIAILPACWSVAHLRIAEEERWLHVQHGDAYLAYCSNTGRWLPLKKIIPMCLWRQVNPASDRVDC
jgi:protein-S-isoprenylcysteine O-methyltransferase Ste14